MQARHRFFGAFLCKVDVGTQELDIVPNGLGNLAVDTVEREHRVFHLAFLEVNAREPVCGVIAYGLIDCALKHGLDRAACTMVHTIAKLEIAKRELGIIEMYIQTVELGLVNRHVLAHLAVQPLERLEVVSLVGLIQRLTKVEVIQIFIRRSAA